MKLSRQDLRRSMNAFLNVLMVLLVLNLGTGCAHSKTSRTTETVATPASQTVVVEKETTKTEEDHHGVVGGVFHVVGEVIAFPFQLVADVFRFIF